MKKLTALTLALALAFSLAACGGNNDAAANTDDTTAAEPADAGENEPESTQAPADDAAPAKPTVDPSGAPISVPDTIDSIVVLAPSLAEEVVALGLGDKIVAYDLNSAGLAGLPEDVPMFDTVNPDVEQLVALAPDVLLVSSLSLYDQEAPYQPLIDTGVCVICVPTNESIDGIRSDITFLAAAFGVQEAGESVLADFNAALDELAGIAASIPDEERKSVYFEISPAPYMYSTGAGTYLHEMIELIGAENILANEDNWIGVEAETVVAADPDVIFTNVNYMDDAVQEILDRDGWAGVRAVANSEVYYIDNMASSLPNQNIVAALRQMAEALYPAYYADAAA